MKIDLLYGLHTVCVCVYVVYSWAHAQLLFFPFSFDSIHRMLARALLSDVIVIEIVAFHVLPFTLSIMILRIWFWVSTNATRVKCYWWFYVRSQHTATHPNKMLSCIDRVWRNNTILFCLLLCLHIPAISIFLLKLCLRHVYIHAHRLYATMQKHSVENVEDWFRTPNLASR